jgi:hypothetical protein
MNKIKILIGLLLLGTFAQAQVVVPRSPASIHAVDARLEITRNAILPRYNDTTQANLDLGKDSIGAIIMLRATGQVFVRAQLSGVKYWKQLATLSYAPIWGTIEGDINSQTDLINKLSLKQNLLPPGASNQYWDATGQLRNFPSLLSQFTNDVGFLTTVVDSASITGTGKTGSALKLVGDVVSPGASKVYGTDGSGNKGWYNAPTGSGGGTGGPDTVAIVHKGAGKWNIYADGTASLYDKTDVPGYGVTILNQADSSKLFAADTSSVNGLVGKPRLAALNIPVITNLGTGYREYIPGSGVRTFFTTYALGIDSTTNTNGLTFKLDTTLIASKTWTIAYVAAHGGGGGGAGGPDTVVVQNLGSGTALVRTNGTDSLKVKTVNHGYGIYPVVNPDSSLSFNQDSTPTIRFKEMFPVGTIKYNDSTFDAQPYIQQALTLGSQYHRGVSDYTGDTLWTHNTIQAKSYTGLYGFVIKMKASSTRALGSNSDFATVQLNRWQMVDCFFDRRGTNTDHGWMLSNAVDPFVWNCVFMDNDTTATGGALGFSAFNSMAAYRCRNVRVGQSRFVGAGNFGVQLGNVDGFAVTDIDLFRCGREGLGAEPYNIASEGGIVRNGYFRGIHWRNPAGTVLQGSATGVIISTTSSGGTLENVTFDLITGVGSPAHGIGSYGGYNVHFTNISIDSTNAYGFNFQAPANGNINSSVGLLIENVAVSHYGLGGVLKAGMQLKDIQGATINNYYAAGMDSGFVERGTSERNYGNNFHVFSNSTPFTQNSGRPHPSTYTNIWTDTTGLAYGTVMTYIANQGSRIIASRGSSKPALIDINTADSLYLIKSDTTSANLERVMANSSVLSTGHTIWHVGLNYQFFGGIYNPVKFANGILLQKQAGLIASTSYGQGSIIYSDSLNGTGTDHLWLIRKPGSAPYDLLSGGGGSGGPYFNDFAVVDSAGQHIGFKLKYSDGTYANKIIFPYASGSSGGGGSSFTLTTTGTSGAATYSGGVLNIPNYATGGGSTPTWEQVLTAGSTLTTTHNIGYSTHAPYFFGTNGNYPVVFGSGVASYGTNISSTTSPITGDYTPDITEEFIPVDASSGPVVITLPHISAGIQKFTVKKIDASSNTVTVVLTGGGNIDLSSSNVLSTSQQVRTYGVAGSSTNFAYVIGN